MALTVPAPLERLALTLRLRWLGIAVVVVIFVLLGQLWTFNVVPVTIILGATVLELIGVTLFVRRAASHPEWAVPARERLVATIAEVQVLAELVLLTLGVYLTGGVVSPLLAGYLLYLFVNGLRSSALMLALNGLWATILAVGVITGEYYGYFPHHRIGIFQDYGLIWNAPFVNAVLAGFVAFMILAGAVAIWVGNQTRQRELILARSRDALAERVVQVNTMREISQRLAATLELEPVLYSICEAALNLVKATDVHLFVYDDDLGRFTSGVGLWADGHRGLVVSLPRAEGGLSAAIVKGKQTVVIDNAEAHPFYASLLAKSWRIKAIAGFPIKKADRILGVLNVAFLNEHKFPAEEINTLAALADQAAVAVDNARLYAQVQGKIQELSTLYAVASSSAQLGDPQTLLNDTVGAVVDALHADAGFLAELDRDGRHLRTVAQRGLSPSSQNEIKSESLATAAGFAAEAIATGQPVAVPEIPPDAPSTLQFVNSDQLRSFYLLPLRAQDRTIGILQLMWRSRHQVQMPEANLIAAIGQEIAVGLNNLTLYGETKRRAEELASLRAIGLATTSTLDLREQLRLFNEKVSQLLHPDSFLVGLYDETQSELKVEYLVEDGWSVRRPTIPLDPGSLAAQVVQNQKALQVPLVGAGQDIYSRAESDLERPPKSWLGVPVVLKDNTAGLIAVTGYKPNAFSAEDERFLSAAAQQVALAVDNARLYAESERRTRELMLINEIGRAVNASLNPHDVIERAAHALVDLLGYRYVSILLLEGAVLRLQAGIGFEADDDLVPLEEGIIGRVARTGNAALVNNILADPDCRPVQPDVIAEACVPIEQEGSVLGVVDIQESRAGTLQTDDLELLTGLADQLAVAIRNSQLYAQTVDQLDKLKQTQSRLVESERRAAIGELAAGLAHEINNPLTAILGHTQLMLQASFSSPENLSTELTAINGAAQRIHRIVKEFVRVANIEAIRRELVDLRPIVRDAIASVKMTEGAQQVTFDLQMPEKALWVNGSKTLLNQVVVNILMNAVEAMPSGGHIQEELVPRENDLVLTFRDTGCGIDPENLKRVFEPGFTTKVEKGTVRGVGMGLYTSERIMHNHGGTIAIDSSRGSGTTVTLTMPRVQTDSQVQNQAPGPES